MSAAALAALGPDRPLLASLLPRSPPDAIRLAIPLLLTPLDLLLTGASSRAAAAARATWRVLTARGSPARRAAFAHLTLALSPARIEADGSDAAAARINLVRDVLESAVTSADSASSASQIADAPALDLALSTCAAALHSREPAVRDAAKELLLRAHATPGAARRVEDWLKADVARLEAIAPPVAPRAAEV